MNVRRLRARQEFQFFAALYRAAPGLAVAWWALLVLRGVLPAVLAVAAGVLIAAVEGGDNLTGPLIVVGVAFVGQSVVSGLHMAVSSNLGSRLAAWLYDRLIQATTEPPGMAHLERPELTNDLTMARDFDLGIMGPPLDISMDFIGSGLVQFVAGFASALVLFGFAPWAPPVLLAGWMATHWMLRETAVWKDRNTDEVRRAQRDAEYAYRLAVDAPAAKEVRLFGLSPWIIDRFVTVRTNLYDLQRHATRLREKSVAGALAIVLAANVVVFWFLADAAADGRISLGATVAYMTSAAVTGTIAFGGWSWALDGAAAPVAAIARLEPAMREAGRLDQRGTTQMPNAPERSIAFRDLTFGYESIGRPVLDGLNLEIPAGSSIAIVGQNGAGKTTLAKLLCRLYEPQSGSIEIDGVDLRRVDVESWRRRVTAVFQDFVRYELTLRENVAPMGAPDDVITRALRGAGADDLANLDTILAKGYPGGIDLSGGQWQRIALARALCAVEMGAGVVLLDEPTAQLDVRGESEIFERILAAARHCTTILISHRFSTVRLADRICVLEQGRVIEFGSHAELIALGAGTRRCSNCRRVDSRATFQSSTSTARR